MSLADWLRNGWLEEHRTSGKEIRERPAVVERDIENAQVPSLSPEWRLAIAYNAALQAATAALAAAGYRPAREAHHYRVIQSLAHTIRADNKTIDRLDAFRKKRNISSYERTGVVSEPEAREMLMLASRLQQRVRDWLRAEHPELLGK